MDNPWATWQPQPEWTSAPTAARSTPPPPAPVAVPHSEHAAPPDDDWGAAWATPSSQSVREQPDVWVPARQENERLNRAVPPELLQSILRHCQQVSEEIWPPCETSSGDSWRSGFDDLDDVAKLLAHLVPADLTLPPLVQFSATATAKAMNEALKRTRHLPVAASSPLSRSLASKGSLAWEQSIKSKQHTVPDAAAVGWRVLEKERRLGTVDESKSTKAATGLLSFWNRRVSAIPAAPVEIPTERSKSPARLSLDSIKSALHPQSSPVASPSTTPISSAPPPPSPEVAVPATASSAVSRFLNRFSRTKSAQHSALALSSDDLEFLSDIVPSASDPHDDNINDSALEVLSGSTKSSPLPPKLPPPIPPPPKQPILSSRPASTVGPGTSVSMVGTAPTALQVRGAPHAPNVPVLASPLSPQPAASFSPTQSPTLPLKDVVIPTNAFGRKPSPSIQQRLQMNSQSNSRPHSPFTLPPPLKVPASHSIPPLLPPPPVSSPQTPRQSALPSITMPDPSSTRWSSGASSFHDSHDSDDEFSAFAAFPSALFPSSDSFSPQRSPSPPSPPPRRTYERTHYPSSSSGSSILSPSFQTGDRLWSTRSTLPVSLDNFDEFVSSPSVTRGGTTPSPPPLPVKPQSQRQQLHLTDTFTSPVYHAHTQSQTFISPTVHTGLMNSTISTPSVSDAEHQRTQSLVNQAASRGGLLWPKSPESPEEPSVRAIPPPPSSSTSPKLLIREGSFDLLGDGDTFSGGVKALPAPLSVASVGGLGIAMESSVHSPAMGASRAPLQVAGGAGMGIGMRNQLQRSPPPIHSTSTPTLSFSSLGVPAPATKAGSLQPARPRQTGGLSAQDLSFFEGL